MCEVEASGSKVKCHFQATTEANNYVCYRETDSVQNPTDTLARISKLIFNAVIEIFTFITVSIVGSTRIPVSQ